MWFLEHLYSHNHAARFTSDWSNYVSTHNERVAEVDFSKGVLAFEEKLSDKIILMNSSKVLLNIIGSWNYDRYPRRTIFPLSFTSISLWSEIILPNQISIIFTLLKENQEWEEVKHKSTIYYVGGLLGL